MTPIDPHLLNAAPTAPFDRAMALRMFAALAQPSRLAVFLQIVEAGPVGCSARMLAETLAMTGSALTLHLRALESAQLVAIRLKPRGGGDPLFVVHADRWHALAGWLGERFRDGGWLQSEPTRPSPSSAAYAPRTKTIRD
jgi:DNA-binding transcriptional ArsR family regulator